jgi:DNA repair photolyase
LQEVVFFWMIQLFIEVTLELPRRIYFPSLQNDPQQPQTRGSLVWTRCSAFPYIDCQHGCEFFYCREQKYSPYDNPQDFAYIIKIKENAPELLRRALKRATGRKKRLKTAKLGAV